MQKFYGLITVLALFALIVVTAVFATQRSKEKIENSQALLVQATNTAAQPTSANQKTETTGYLSQCGATCDPFDDKCLPGMACTPIVDTIGTKASVTFQCALDVCIKNSELCKGGLCLENSLPNDQSDTPIEGAICEQLDHDGNGSIDIVDFVEFAKWYKFTCGNDPCRKKDLDGDNKVGIGDLQKFAVYFGNQACKTQ